MHGVSSYDSRLVPVLTAKPLDMGMPNNSQQVAACMAKSHRKKHCRVYVGIQGSLALLAIPHTQTNRHVILTSHFLVNFLHKELFREIVNILALL